MSRPLAIVRAVSPSIGRCELTHLERTPIDPSRAARQHARYCETLERLGLELLRLPAEPEQPDSVFVEDTAVVLDDLAVITRPGAQARRAETERVAAALAPHRECLRIEAPGTLDGGDLLVVGRRIFVGRSTRSSPEGAAQLARLLEPRGYRVREVAVEGCLHLKSAVTAIGRERVLVQPEWIDAAALEGLRQQPVDPAEPFAANVLRIGEAVVIPEAFPRTAERLAGLGLEPRPVPADELAKAEGGVTCCSLIVGR